MTVQPHHGTRVALPVASTSGGTQSSQTDRPGTPHDLSDLDRNVPDEPTCRLIETHVHASKLIARRYRDRGVDVEDLEQVALVALTKAARRFDPDAGHDFMSYAAATIRGEIRRHFRDSAWMIRPPRRVQELQAHLRDAQQELEMQLGRSPRPTELAAHLGECLEAVVEALSADGCYTPTSLDTSVGDGSAVLSDLLASDDNDVECAEARIMLAPVLRRLTDRDRFLLQMRYVDQLSQQEIADAIGLSQPQVSRLLVGLMLRLRDELTESAGTPKNPPRRAGDTGPSM